MKKIIVRLLIALLVLVLLTVVAVHLFLDSAVKRAVETIGPDLTKVSVKLDSVNLILLSGSCKIGGLVVGNPQGYKSPSAIRVGTVSVAVEPASLLADKIIVNSINMQAPEVTFETDLRQNNLSKILSNLDETSGGTNPPAQPKEAGSMKKLEVDDFVISGGKIRVVVSTFSGKTATAALPEIHLKDLGKGPDGITVAELSRRVLQALEQGAAQAAAGAIADLSKGALYLSNEPGKIATNTVDKVTHGIGDLFKKKQ
jgi:uncharacterized protein involved in outer membrane biogenesis